jgi:uncharacterized cupin superfamily protein
MISAQIVYFPEGADGLHTLSNATDEPARIIGISTKWFPDVVAYPERGVAWLATRDPERSVEEGADKGSSLDSIYRPRTEPLLAPPLRPRRACSCAQ